MTDLRPMVLVNDVPLTECEATRGTSWRHGMTYAGFDPERRRVEIWLHPDVMPGGVDDEGDNPDDVMRRAAYADRPDRLPRLQNTELPEPPRFRLPWE